MFAVDSVSRSWIITAAAAWLASRELASPLVEFSFEFAHIMLAAKTGAATEKSIAAATNAAAGDMRAAAAWQRCGPCGRRATQRRYWRRL